MKEQIYGGERMEINERQSHAKNRRVRRKRQVLVGRIVVVVLALAIVMLCIFLFMKFLGEAEKNPKDSSMEITSQDSQNGNSTVKEINLETESETETETEEQTEAGEDFIAQADRLAAMYDYDGAIDLLKNSGMYAGNSEMEKAVAGYEAEKATCEEYPLDQITHVFFHTLIYDAGKAFDGDRREGGYNQVMTTIDEFNKIINSMYEKGYVMVSLHDMAKVKKNGTVSKKKILLPPGKKPFVLSQDDVSYYHYMDGDGMASRLVLDENGKVKNEYIEDDGSVSIGDYDMIPLIDSFVEEHPDFSYRGSKGIIALTGYEGVLGYRTDEVYKTREESRLVEDQRRFFEEHPDYDYDADVAAAKEVADAMKETGWEFASHTWGHNAPKEMGLDGFKTDTQRWLDNVAPIVGDTDVIIFAFGADIGSWEPYTSDNPFFAYLKEKGFHIFCNVDSSQYWVQFGEDFMRQGRRNLDGYRMFYNPEMLEDLFDANEVFESSRPTPVPPMGSAQ